MEQVDSNYPVELPATPPPATPSLPLPLPPTLVALPPPRPPPSLPLPPPPSLVASPPPTPPPSLPLPPPPPSKSAAPPPSKSLPLPPSQFAAPSPTLPAALLLFPPPPSKSAAPSPSQSAAPSPYQSAAPSPTMPPSQSAAPPPTPPPSLPFPPPPSMSGVRPASPPASPNKSTMAQDVPPGYLGNLNPAQEAKLRALWAIGYKFVEICEADASFSEAVTLEDKFVPPAMKPGVKQSKKDKGKGKGKGSITHMQHPTLLNELLSLLPPDERNVRKLAKESLEALDYWTPHMFRIIILHAVKQEHPDELALRFLRHCNWDIIKACKTMGKTIYWRTMEVAVDDDILRLGEGGAAEDEKNGQGHARVQGAEFMQLLRSGKGFLHGNDRLGRPISYIRVRLHKSGDQSRESMERFIIYLLEMARLSLRFPVESGTLFIDMSGFRLSNLDPSPLKFILKCVERHYPESIGLVLIHKSPFGSKAIWQMIRHWVSSNIADKVKFTRDAKDLAKYIDPSQILKMHGGQDEWQYKYEEPMMDENFKMQNTMTRNYLLLERQMLVEQFEQVTKEWYMNAQGTGKAIEVGARRDKVCADLAANFWELDPYVRARSHYDRSRCLSNTGNLQYHPPKSERRHPDSIATGARSMSIASSNGAGRSSIARSLMGYAPSGYAPSFGMTSGGARSGISASAGSGTLVTCSILGSPVKENQFAETATIDIAMMGDESSYYSD